MNSSVILYIRLFVPKVKAETALDGKSWLLVSASRLKDLEIYGFADPSKTKNPNLGRVFSNLLPQGKDEFTLELGAILPDLFSNVDGKPDFAVQVDRSGQQHTLCVSNRMVQLRYSQGDEQWHAIVPQSSGQNTAQSDKNPDSDEKPAASAGRNDELLKTLEIPRGAHATFLKTMATCRFVIHGSDAEDALSKELDEKVSTFIDLLNRFAMANLMVERQQSAITTPIYDRNTLDSLYMIIAGKDEGKFGIGRLGLNIFKLQLNPGDYTAAESAAVRAFLDGSKGVDEARRYLSSAKSYLDGGLLPTSLLHLAIAVEMATTRFVHAKLLAAGVSKSQLDGADDQLTFSKMLNVDLFVVCPSGRKPDRPLVGQINEIRRLRNALMHEGQFTATRAKVGELHGAAKRFLEFLEAQP